MVAPFDITKNFDFGKRSLIGASKPVATATIYRGIGTVNGELL